MPSRHPEEYRKMLLRLRQARMDAQLTQEAVAEKIGVRQNLVSKMELGERRIDVVELAEFAKLYDKPLEFFVD